MGHAKKSVSGKSLAKKSAINKASLQAFESTMKERARNAVFSDPDRALDEFTKSTRKLLSSLEPIITEAADFIKRARQRRETGELDNTAMLAEIAPAEIFIALHKMLRLMYEKVCHDEELHGLDLREKTYAIRRINLAAYTLAAHGDEELLSEGNYPEKDEEIRDGRITHAFLFARQIHEDVVEVLDDTNAKLGVDIPELFKAEDLN